MLLLHEPNSALLKFAAFTLLRLALKRLPMLLPLLLATFILLAPLREFISKTQPPNPSPTDESRERRIHLIFIWGMYADYGIMT
uniref:Uncharacterized protein n=1 Tax=Parascaris univalens TaxID=6257 RepID=A0A915BRW1_PARUN